MFYMFSQNNSGGSFDLDLKRGISEYVIIEANSSDEAIDKALEIGLYFDGEGDCPCCGYRWSSFCEETETPLIYSEEPSKYKSFFTEYHTCIHYSDGRIEAVRYEKNE